jgi:hypothetical protein
MPVAVTNMNWYFAYSKFLLFDDNELVIKKNVTYRK